MSSQEFLIADFSGGVNPSTQPDKLLPNESLQAINCRIDELGGLASAPFSSVQASALTDSAGNTTAHSVFYDNAVGAVSGVGQDIFAGATVGSLANVLSGSNTSQQKMSFGAAPTRVYFDSGQGNTGYAFDPSLTSIITVDWAPPQAGAGATTTKTAGTGGTVTRAGSAVWTNAGNITGTTGFATVPLAVAGPSSSQYLKATGFGFSLTTNTLQGIQVNATAKLSGPENVGYVTVNATLLRNGVAVGLTQFSTIFQSSNINLVWGNSTFLWGANLTAADLNNANFGVLFTAQISPNASITPITFEIQNVTVTASQVATGFVAGTAGSGTNLAGTYSYAITNVAADGAESDLSASSLGVVLGGAAGTLTSIPAGDARTTSRNVYRIGGTLNSFYLVGSISDNVSTTYYDNQSDIAALTEGVIAAGGVAGLPANSRLGNTPVRFPCYHLDRLFWVTPNQPNQIIWSQPLNAFAYPANNSDDVGDSKPITGLISKWGCLIIIKASEVWILSGNDESNFSLTKSESVVGSDQPFTITQLANAIVFGNSANLYAFNGALSTKLNPKLDLLFRNESRNGLPAIETQVKSVTANYCAAATSEYLYYACAAKGTLVNNMLLAINLNTGTITTRSVDISSLTVDNVNDCVYAGLSSGKIVKLDDYFATADVQGNLPWTLQSRFTDCGARGSNLVFWGYEFYGNTNGVSVTPTIFYDNGNNSEVLAPFSTTTNKRVRRQSNATNSRLAQTMSLRLDASIPANSVGVEVIHIKLLYEIRPGNARVGNLS